MRNCSAPQFVQRRCAEVAHPASGRNRGSRYKEACAGIAGIRAAIQIARDLADRAQLAGLAKARAAPSGGGDRRQRVGNTVGFTCHPKLADVDPRSDPSLSKRAPALNSRRIVSSCRLSAAMLVAVHCDSRRIFDAPNESPAEQCGATTRLRHVARIHKAAAGSAGGAKNGAA